MMRSALLVLVAACSGGRMPTTGDAGGEIDSYEFHHEGLYGLRLPPPGALVDYQLGGAYTPPAGVKIVSRDRTAARAAGLYNICYVNGFQIQPEEEAFWLGSHPTLILRDDAGDPIIDADWNEMLIDVSTAAKRAEVLAIVNGWIEGCALAGYDAVEIDNLDSYTRSQNRLSEANAVAAMRSFSVAAHDNSLAVAQKNSSELAGRKADLETDFAVAEECNHYQECGDYTAAYGNQVIVIEYVRADFTAGCTNFPQLSTVLRDRDLVTPTTAGYVFDGC